VSSEAGHAGRLPIIVPLVVYNGTVRWGGLKRFSDQVEAIPGQKPHLLDFPYLVIDLGREPDDALSHEPHLRAGLRLLKYAFVLPEGERVQVLAWLLEGFADRPDFLVFAVSYILRSHRDLDKQAIRGALQQIAPGKADEMLSKAAEELMAEAAEAATLKAKRATVLLLLEHRFGALHESIRERVASAEIEVLDAWAVRLLDARSLDEVFDGDAR
jgi:hypothetical protein